MDHCRHTTRLRRQLVEILYDLAHEGSLRKVLADRLALAHACHKQHAVAPAALAGRNGESHAAVYPVLFRGGLPPKVEQHRGPSSLHEPAHHGLLVQTGNVYLQEHVGGCWDTQSRYGGAVRSTGFELRHELRHELRRHEQQRAESEDHKGELSLEAWAGVHVYGSGSASCPRVAAVEMIEVRGKNERREGAKRTRQRADRAW
eukprot:scaffold53740_cov68-Phaeocystis_antarctica.AAC.6